MSCMGKYNISQHISVFLSSKKYYFINSLEVLVLTMNNSQWVGKYLIVITKSKKKKTKTATFLLNSRPPHGGRIPTRVESQFAPLQMMVWREVKYTPLFLATIFKFSIYLITEGASFIILITLISLITTCKIHDKT